MGGRAWARGLEFSLASAERGSLFPRPTSPVSRARVWSAQAKSSLGRDAQAPHRRPRRMLVPSTRKGPDGWQAEPSFCDLRGACGPTQGSGLDHRDVSLRAPASCNLHR